MLWPIIGISALVTLVILAVTAVVVVRRLQKIHAQVQAIEQQLMPSIDQLQADLEITSREIARITGDPVADEEHDADVAQVRQR